MKLLITAFEPFGPWLVNPTAQVARAAARELGDGVSIRVLPVDVIEAPARLREALTERPDAVLSLGLSGRARAVALERVAVNLADFAIPDNAGNQPRSERLIADAPDAWLCGVDLHPLRENLLALDVPVELSLSAGSYVCNAVYFQLLSACRPLGRPALFVHLPPLPGQAARAQVQGPGESRIDASAGLDEAVQVRAVVAAARYLLGACAP